MFCFKVGFGTYANKYTKFIKTNWPQLEGHLQLNVIRELPLQKIDDKKMGRGEKKSLLNNAVVFELHCIIVGGFFLQIYFLTMMQYSYTKRDKINNHKTDFFFFIMKTESFVQV